MKLYIDAVIIGAGPAGTAAAFDLLVKGFSVFILDKYEFPKEKACAGGITPKVKAGHTEIRTGDQLIKARYLIGADGANSRVRHLTDPFCRVVRYPAIEADIRVKNSDFYKMEFDFSIIK